jgi:hypothetical protein
VGRHGREDESSGAGDDGTTEEEHQPEGMRVEEMLQTMYSEEMQFPRLYGVAA